MESEIDSSNMSKASQKAFFEELSKRALEAADRSDKVVVRYVTNSSRDCQDSLVNRLIAGGASEENITVVRLSMDQGTKTLQSRSFYRTNYCTWRPKTVLAWVAGNAPWSQKSFCKPQYNRSTGITNIRQKCSRYILLFSCIYTQKSFATNISIPPCSFVYQSTTVVKWVRCRWFRKRNLFWPISLNGK